MPSAPPLRHKALQERTHQSSQKNSGAQTTVTAFLDAGRLIREACKPGRLGGERGVGRVGGGDGGHVWGGLHGCFCTLGAKGRGAASGNRGGAGGGAALAGIAGISECLQLTVHKATGLF